jgi:hypothetical protein
VNRPANKSVMPSARDSSQARTVAAQVARKAYWNSSYFGGTFDELTGAGFGRDPQRAALAQP